MALQLRPATADDRRWIHAAMVREPAWSTMTGGPPAQVAPSFDAFCDDYAPWFFDGTQPRRGQSFVIEVDGRAVGQINHDVIEPVRARTELDIWLRDDDDRGHGYGPAAIDALCARLRRDHGVREFVIQPWASNTRAVRAYTRAGFSPLAIPLDHAVREYGEPDSPAPLTMLRNEPEPDELVVRPLLRGEERDVCDLVAEVFHAQVAADFTDEGIREFLGYAEADAMARRCDEASLVLVARRDDLVGMIEVRDLTHVALFFVRGARQGEGIGRTLFDEALRWIPDDATREHPVDVNSSVAAEPVYASLGFTRTEEPRVLGGILFVPMARKVT